MRGPKGVRKAAEESYQHPQDEIDACRTCHLPDCIPQHRECNLRVLRTKKQGREIKLK